LHILLLNLDYCDSEKAKIEYPRITLYASRICENENHPEITFLCESVYAYYRSYQALNQKSDLENARKICVGLLKQKPNESSYWLLLAKLYDDTLQIKQNCIFQALSLDPENETAWTSLAFSYYTNNDLKGCLKCLGEIKDLNPLNNNLHLCQAIVYYSLWILKTESQNYLESAWGHIGDYLENASSSVMGWVIKGLLAIEKKQYDEAYLYLDNVMNSVEYSQKVNAGSIKEWEELNLKYLKAILKSGKNKSVDSIIDKISEKFSQKSVLKSKINNIISNNANISEINSKADLKKINMKIANEFIKTKLVKIDQKLISAIPKYEMRSAAIFGYLNYVNAILENNETKINSCIETIAECKKELIKGIKYPKCMRHLLKANYYLYNKDLRKCDQELRIFYNTQPDLAFKFPNLLKRNGFNNSLHDVKLEYYRNPGNPNIKIKLLTSMIQSGEIQNIQNAINANKDISKENEQIVNLGKSILEVSLNKFTPVKISEINGNSEIYILLTIFNTLKNKDSIIPLADLQTSELITQLLSKSTNKLKTILILYKAAYLLHSFGYHNSAISLSMNLIDIINTEYEKETDHANYLSKSLIKITHILVAITGSSLLNIEQHEKADQILNDIGFSIAEDSVALNTLYLQTIKKKLFDNQLAKTAFATIKYRPASQDELFLADMYTAIQYLQLNGLQQFAQNVEKLQQMLNSISLELNEAQISNHKIKYGILPVYAKAYVEALHGLYAMKMVHFLTKEKEEYKDSERDLLRIQKKIDECLNTCAIQLKHAIFMYPDPEFCEMLKDTLRKFFKSH